MSLRDYAFQLTQMKVEGASGYKSHIQKCDVQEDRMFRNNLKLYMRKHHHITMLESHMIT
jgi:hypothetical protein